MSTKKTLFTIIGAGNRGMSCFGVSLTQACGKGRPEFAEKADVAALVDTNLSRAQMSAREMKRPNLPVFTSLREAQKVAPADWAIVTTPDFTHADVVCEALDLGLNVVVDKPLASCVRDCDRIIRKMRETGRKLVVGHNMRYSRGTLEAYKLVHAGAIGRVIAVEGAEILDYNHGGDYFHRWHSDFSKSAGLMTHKCCHHLDILNWIIDDEPVAVSAMGGRTFYRPRPDLNHGKRCSECPISATCPHFYDFDLWDGYRRRLYRDTEGEDGYMRDLCCFSDRHTINDHEILNIRYKSGVLASFSLVTFSPRESWYHYFTGTDGRLEVGVSSDAGKPFVRIIRRDKSVENMDFARGSGEHGHTDADNDLIADLIELEGSLPIQRAKPEEARRAVLIADMAARSIADGSRCVQAEETGKDFPPPPPRPAAV